MWHDAADATYWLLLVIQILGMGGMVAARTVSPGWGYLACYLGILLVGGASICAMCCGSGLWMSCGTTLALVAVGATWESGAAPDAF